MARCQYLLYGFKTMTCADSNNDLIDKNMQKGDPVLVNSVQLFYFKFLVLSKEQLFDF